MKSFFFALLVFAASATYAADNRPKILGIDHVAFYTTSPEANRHLYGVVLGLSSGEPVERSQTQRYLIGRQWVGYSPAPDPKGINRMDHVAFATDNCAVLRSYLAAHGVKAPDSLEHLKDGRSTFHIKDPEDHDIEFIEASGYTQTVPQSSADAISRHMIHVGFVVHNRDAEDRFYRDILGFHIYWYGGMTDNVTDWVAMQVPDGTDWLEYMLNGGPNPDQHTTGVMGHISLGVKDMKQSQAKLQSRGWKPHDREHAQMGRDGKWQLNVYDPDLTRVELMEFEPVQKPCCSDFAGPQPTE